MLFLNNAHGTGGKGGGGGGGGGELTSLDLIRRSRGSNCSGRSRVVIVHLGPG